MVEFSHYPEPQNVPPLLSLPKNVLCEPCQHLWTLFLQCSTFVICVDKCRRILESTTEGGRISSPFPPASCSLKDATTILVLRVTRVVGVKAFLGVVIAQHKGLLNHLDGLLWGQPYCWNRVRCFSSGRSVQHICWPITNLSSLEMFSH